MSWNIFSSWVTWAPGKFVVMCIFPLRAGCVGTNFPGCYFWNIWAKLKYMNICMYVCIHIWACIFLSAATFLFLPSSSHLFSIWKIFEMWYMCVVGRQYILFYNDQHCVCVFPVQTYKQLICFVAKNYFTWIIPILFAYII